MGGYAAVGVEEYPRPDITKLGDVLLSEPEIAVNL